MSKGASFVWPIGTFVNMLTVTIGSLIGVALQQIIPPGVEEIVFQAIGLGTILIGLKMMFKLPDGYMLLFIFSLIIGGVIGELIQLESIINGLSDQLKEGLGFTDEGFTEGLITAFLLFCIGSMTIVGSLEEGINGDRELVYIKSLLDGFSSIALAASFGIGVFFSIIPMLFVQGGLTIFARKAKPYLNNALVDSMSSVGGALIIGISIVLLKLGELRLYNLLPALILIVFAVMIYQRFKGSPSDDRQ